MKRTLLSLFAFLLLFTVSAQQPFTGTIAYKFTSFAAPGEDNDHPDDLTFTYGHGKLLMLARFHVRHKTESVLVNTLNDTLYTMSSEQMTYRAESLRDWAFGDFQVKLQSTDSFKTYFGHRCRGYFFQMEPGDKPQREATWLWLAEDMTGIPQKPEYKHPVLLFSGAPYVMLAMEMYQNGERQSIALAEKITALAAVPDSVFALTGYREEKREYDIIQPGPPSERAVNDTALTVERLQIEAAKGPPPPPPPPPPKKPVKKAPVKKTAARKPH